MDGLGYFEAVIVRKQGYGSLNVWVIENLCRYLVEGPWCLALH
jgi:hypothetical protein